MIIICQMDLWGFGGVNTRCRRRYQYLAHT